MLRSAYLLDSCLVRWYMDDMMAASKIRDTAHRRQEDGSFHWEAQ